MKVLLVIIILSLWLVLYFQIRLKIFITTKINQMKEDLEQIKADLLASNESLAKVSADVDRLHAKIDEIGDQPSPSEWAEVKELAATLKSGLQTVDEKTEE